jgi:hypothetical protein
LKGKSSLVVQLYRFIALLDFYILLGLYLVLDLLVQEVEVFLLEDGFVSKDTPEQARDFIKIRLLLHFYSIQFLIIIFLAKT